MRISDWSSDVCSSDLEAEEELAMPRDQVDVIGVSDSFRTYTGFEVTPVLGVVPPGLSLIPHEHEVADWFEMPLEYALDADNQVRRWIEFQGSQRPYYERSEEHTSELQSLMRISYAVFCLKKKIVTH